MNDIQKFQAVLRTDLALFIRKVLSSTAPGATYIPNWHINGIAHQLERCSRGEVKRLIITIPPRYLKSISASVAFPAWVLGHDPSKKIICASYAQDLSVKHSLDCRSVMESDWYRNCFPHTRPHPHKNTQNEFMTTRQGYRLATSVGGTLTGRGGNLIIIDDPHKPDEVESDTKRKAVISWFQNTVLTRLDNKKDDVIILIQQRLHEQDLAGVLIDTGEWVHLNLPAIAEEDEHIPIGNGHYYDRNIGDVLHPERESLEDLEQMKKSMGSYAFAAQYQQRPAPLGGGLLKWKWFKPYKKFPDKCHGDLLVQSWDTASKAGELNDWSVCTTWLCHGNQYYLRNVLRERLEYPDLKKKVQSMYHKWNADLVLIEAVNAGIPLLQELRANSPLQTVPIFPKDDKATRMMAESPAIEAGRVLIPTEASWLADFQHEIVRFPNGKHDDQVDSLSQFCNWARKREHSSVPQLKVTVVAADPPSLFIDDLFNTPLF